MQHNPPAALWPLSDTKIYWRRTRFSYIIDRARGTRGMTRVEVSYRIEYVDLAWTVRSHGIVVPVCRLPWHQAIRHPAIMCAAVAPHRGRCVASHCERHRSLVSHRCRNAAPASPRKRLSPVERQYLPPDRRFPLTGVRTRKRYLIVSSVAARAATRMLHHVQASPVLKKKKREMQLSIQPPQEGIDLDPPEGGRIPLLEEGGAEAPTRGALGVTLSSGAARACGLHVRADLRRGCSVGE